MSRKFLVSLDLNKNELLNARLQNLSSDPSSPVAGQIYYNTQDKVTKFYDGTQWVAGGSVKFGNTAARPAASKSGTLYVDTQAKTIYVDNGTSWVQGVLSEQDVNDLINTAVTSGEIDAVFNTVETVSNGAGQNIKIGDDAWLGDVDQANTVNVKGVEDSTQGYISFGNDGGQNSIGKDADGNLVLNSNTGNIHLYMDGAAYIGNATTNNRIATIGDLNSDAVIQSVSGTNNQIVVDNTAGDVTISLPSEVHIKRGSDNYPSIMLNADSATISVNDPATDNRVLDIYNSDSNAILASQFAFNIESNNGNITLTPPEISRVILDGNTDVNNGLRVSNELTVGGWDNIDGRVSVQNADGAWKFSIDSSTNNGTPVVDIWDDTKLRFADSFNEIYTGNIWLDPSTPGKFNINATGELNLTTDGSQGSGNIVLNPDGHVQVQGNLNASNRLFAGSGIYVGGQDYENDGFINIQDYNGENLFSVNTDGNNNGGTATVTLKGQFDVYQPGAFGNKAGHIKANVDNNLVIDATANDLILTSDSGNAYMNSISTDNRIITVADLAAVSSGLSWKQAVNLLYSDATPTLSGDTVTSPLAIDGHAALDTPEIGYRVLVTNGNDAGIYEYAQTGTSWTLNRTTDADTFAELKGAAVFVMEGSQYGSTSWVQSNHYITDFTGQEWSQFSGQGTYIGSNSIEVDGQQINAIVDSTRGLAIDTNGVYAKIGDGLSFDGSGNLAIEYGAGFDTSSGSLNFATGYGVRKYTTTIGNNSSTSFNIDHNFDTRHVTVQVFEAGSPYAQVETDVERTTADRVTIKFASAPGTGEYEVVIVG